MSEICDASIDEFCLEENSNDTKKEEAPNTSNFFNDLVNSPEVQTVAAVAAVGAAFAYKAMTGNDVCVAGVCTHSDHDHGDCGHGH